MYKEIGSVIFSHNTIIAAFNKSKLSNNTVLKCWNIYKYADIYTCRRKKGPQGWSKVENPSKGLIGW